MEKKGSATKSTINPFDFSSMVHDDPEVKGLSEQLMKDTSLCNMAEQFENAFFGLPVDQKWFSDMEQVTDPLVTPVEHLRSAIVKDPVMMQMLKADQEEFKRLMENVAYVSPELMSQMLDEESSELKDASSEVMEMYWNDVEFLQKLGDAVGGAITAETTPPTAETAPLVETPPTVETDSLTAEPPIGAETPTAEIAPAPLSAETAPGGTEVPEATRGRTETAPTAITAETTPTAETAPLVETPPVETDPLTAEPPIGAETPTAEIAPAPLSAETAPGGTEVPEATRGRTEEEKAKKKAYEKRAKAQKAFAKENYEVAVAAYTQAIELGHMSDKTMSDVYFGRGMCYLRMGQMEKHKADLHTSDAYTKKCEAGLDASDAYQGFL